MSINEEFEKKLNDSIDIMLDYENFQEDIDLLKHKQKWNFDSEFNFVYGQLVGRLEGFALGSFSKTFGRVPSPQEKQLLEKIVSSKASFIREKISKLKS